MRCFSTLFDVSFHRMVLHFLLTNVCFDSQTEANEKHCCQTQINSQQRNLFSSSKSGKNHVHAECYDFLSPGYRYNQQTFLKKSILTSCITLLFRFTLVVACDAESLQSHYVANYPHWCFREKLLSTSNQSQAMQQLNLSTSKSTQNYVH